ncbi:MAG: GAF domain-containing protein [Candidatus Wallbacteria bacterium]|nr:GAF domain-containing protein [Candidatus Wallbacteria bacterium]
MTEPSAHALLDQVRQGPKSFDELADRLLDMPREQSRAQLVALLEAYKQGSAQVEVASFLGSKLELAALIQDIVFKISALLNADRTSLFLIDRQRSQLWSKVAQGLQTKEIRIPMDRGLAGLVATKGEPLNIPDVYDHPLFNRDVDKATGYRTMSMLAAPITNPAGEIVGVIQAINKRGGPFTGADLALLRSLSTILAVALENSLLYERVVAQQRNLDSLLGVANALTSQLDLTTLVQSIMGKACEILSADRATLFLLDKEKDQLWSKVAKGSEIREIRFPRSVGIAGHVATTGEPLNIQDAYQSPLFNPEFDKKTGYRTQTILCMPIRNTGGEVIGVTQVINKKDGVFTVDDEQLLGAFSAQAAIALENAQLYERVVAQQRQVESLLNVANALSSELDLSTLIQTIMGKACDIMEADRATLFLLDKETGELWSKSTQGGEIKEIRFPKSVGIAGHVATTGEPLNIEDAYESPLFNPEFDKKTGYRTRTILCMPIRNNSGEVMGVTQLINKKKGVFTPDDEQLLQAFSAQAAIALENAQLFDSVLHLKNYLESVLNNMSNGVMSVDSKQRVTLTNQAATRILEVTAADPISRRLDEVLGEGAGLFAEKFQRVMESGQALTEYDRDYKTATGKPLSMNVSIQPLKDQRAGTIVGSVAILEDMTREKRTRSMMTRLLSKDVAERLLSGDWEALMRGARQDVTILFSDIRSFTTITEKIGAQETVAMLNEYFSHMVDAIFSFGGTLDKFIGDAIMAIFGAPVHHPNNAVHAVHAAIEMGNRLRTFNAKRVREGKVPIRTGICLSSGEVLCGTIGSEKKMEYTAIGDGVNLASRLESANKYYGTEVLISEFTYAKTAEECRVREIDRVKVKGKHQGVTVYELLGLRESRFDEAQEAHLAAYDEGMRWIGAHRFEQAHRCFIRAVEITPTDRASQLWLERTTELLKSPPPPDWDGTYELKEK